MEIMPRSRTWIIVTFFVAAIGCAGTVGVVLISILPSVLKPAQTLTPEPVSYSIATIMYEETIIGLWYSEVINGGTFEVRQDQDNSGCYEMIVASDENTTSYRGEIIGKMCYDMREEAYIGKHMWGGGKSETTFWGEDGGLIVTIVDSDTLYMRFLDSEYTEGWPLIRLK